MMSALRGQAATWGGAANLPVPWTNDLLENPLFWALAEALDPDAVVLPTLRRSDLHGIVEGVEAPDLPGTARRDDMPLGRPDPRPVLKEIARRAPILQRNGTGRPHNVEPAKGASFPFTRAADLDVLPNVAGARFPGDLDLGLLLTAERGDLHDTQIAELARRSVVAESRTYEDAAEALSLVLDGPGPSHAAGPWALSEAGLRWLSPGFRDEPIVSIVVGDAPWDFAAAYALRRHSSLAWWLPVTLADDEVLVARLAHRLRDLNQEVEHGHVFSSSDPDAAQRLATSLHIQLAEDGIDWRVNDDLPMALRQTANRLLTDASGLESLAVHDGQTGFIPPRLPSVRARLSARLYWMSEVVGVNWQPLPDARVSGAVVRAPAYGSSQARATRDGVAYLCPHFFRSGEEDLESTTIRPQVVPLSLREQLDVITADAKWGLFPSDKGVYAEACSALLGGDAALLDTVTDTGWAGIYAGLREATDPEGETRGWHLKDDRVYFTLAEINAIRAGAGSSAPEIEDLLRRKVLLRGFVFQCPLCAHKAWYGADEMTERLRCARCRRPFTLTEPGWQPTLEPQWRYRLSEVFWQMLQHNGDLPLRALRDVLSIGGEWRAGPVDFLHEHNLITPEGDVIELDICAQRGPELWIGEAKIADNLGTRKAANAKLQGLRRAVELLRPHGVVLVTAADTWSEQTEQAARGALGRLGCELVLASSPALA